MDKSLNLQQLVITLILMKAIFISGSSFLIIPSIKSLNEEKKILLACINISPTYDFCIFNSHKIFLTVNLYLLQFELIWREYLLNM